MKRRNTERHHAYSAEIFRRLGIYDIQGLLKEDNKYNCGLEAYQVADFKMISFEPLNPEVESARFGLCSQLNIPYYIIIVSESTEKYRIYRTEKTDMKINYLPYHEFSAEEFVVWWSRQQSFTQKKSMYNAGIRISESIIDKLLFSNSLSWGVNVDGFMPDNTTGKVKAVFEKRIRTCNGKYTVDTYDPNRFFHGSANRSGDYPSWAVLYDLAAKLGVPLFLFTFDTSREKNAGVTKISGVNRESGIKYKDNIKPCDNIFHGNIEGIKNWLDKNI